MMMSPAKKSLLQNEIGILQIILLFDTIQLKYFFIS